MKINVTFIETSFNNPIGFIFFHLGKPSIKKCVNKENILIYLDPLLPPPSKEIKNKEIFVPFLTPSLLSKIRKSDTFSEVF